MDDNHIICEYCQLKISKSNYSKHLKKKHQEKEKNHLCPKCGLFLSYKDKLNEHISKCKRKEREEEKIKEKYSYDNLFKIYERKKR